MIFQFKPGAHIKGDAQAIGERLSAIEAAGRLTPDAVLHDARNPVSVLHNQFEWDDRKAAHKWRIEQAGYLIRSVTVSVEPNEATARTIRAFVPVEGEQENRSYVPMLKALGDTEMRKQVLKQAHAELGAVARKYRELKELSEVIQAIDQVGDLLRSSEGQPH